MADINNLKPNPKNPRTITKEDFNRLKRKIKNNPDGLTVHKIAHKDGVIKSGNQRYKALKELKLKLKPEWFKDVTGWTEKQIKDWIIDSNISSGLWDKDELLDDWELSELEEMGVTEAKTWAQLDNINESDENSEWVGMPEFDSADKSHKLIIQFETPEDRENFVEGKDLKIQTKGKYTWSTWFPYKERESLIDKQYE